MAVDESHRVRHGQRLILDGESRGTSPPRPPGAYADGVYIMLDPLSVGIHHITFAATGSGTQTFGPASQNLS